MVEFLGAIRIPLPNLKLFFPNLSVVLSFKVSAAVYCGTDMESNHIMVEKWILLLVLL